MYVPSLDNDIAEAQIKLQHARWASNAFKDFDRDQVARIIRAVAGAAKANAARFAEDAVRESGFGVVDDKVAKNHAIVDLFLEEHGDKDFCAPQIDPERKLVRIPRPAGVIFALTPSTSPVAALYFKVLCSLLTRSSIVISPHPAALAVSIEAAQVLAVAAREAGAPEGCIQILERPSVALVNSVMADPLTKLILATGGGAMVHAAYKSGTPALGVGPGNPPLIVDQTADIRQAAKDIVTSKVFDNSVLCTAESVLFAVDSIAPELLRELKSNNAYLCDRDGTARIRDYMYPGGKFNTGVVGRDATTIASAAGVKVPSTTRLLLTPIDTVVDEESLTHEKLSPVLGVRIVDDVDQAISEAQALLRIVGAGHSAVIHSNDSETVLKASVALPAHRISVNCPGSLGNAGIGTTLAPTMSVGTGFVGNSASGDNLEPDHLVQWTKVAYASEPKVAFPDFGPATRALARGKARHDVPPNGAVRAAAHRTTTARQTASRTPSDLGLDRDDLRKLVLEELRTLMEQR